MSRTNLSDLYGVETFPEYPLVSHSNSPPVEDLVPHPTQLSYPANKLSGGA